MQMNTISVIMGRYHPLCTQARQKQTGTADKSSCRQMPSTLQVDMAFIITDRYGHYPIHTSYRQKLAISSIAKKDNRC